MTVWGSQAFIKTLLFLSFICVEYFFKCHLNVTEIYQQYTWIKTDGILITAFSKPSQGFTGTHDVCISLEFDHACHRELIPCCTYFRASSKLTFGNWNEKPSTKSKFLPWNRRTCFFVEFHLADHKEVCSPLTSACFKNVYMGTSVSSSSMSWTVSRTSFIHLHWGLWISVDKIMVGGQC